MNYVKLANGKLISWEDFSTWSAIKQHMSILPPNKGRKFDDEFRRKLSQTKKRRYADGTIKAVSGGDHANARKISTPDGEFGSIKEVGVFYSVRGSTIRDWLKKGKEGFSYIGPPTVRKPQSVKGGVTGRENKSSREVITPLGKFPTIKQAAAELGISTGSLTYKLRYCKSGEYSYAKESEPRKIGLNPNRVKVVTPDGVFETITDAARHYGIKGESMRYRIKSKYMPEFYCFQD